MTDRPSTEALIDALSRRPVLPRVSPGQTTLAMLAAVGAGLGLFLLAYGPRADLALALSQPLILMKSLLPLALAALALWLALGATRPEARLRPWPLILPLGLALALFLARLIQTPADALPDEMLGGTAAACLLSITALSLAPMAAGFALLKRGASTRPTLSGALIGLASGAGAATGYALHCTEDSPLFFVTWYGLAIGLCGIAGALAGRRLLRW